MLDNDHDPNDDLDPASLAIAPQPTAGTAGVVESSDGRRVIEYAAVATGGTDSLAYEVCDALNRCATGEVTVMIGTTGCTIVGTDEAETLRGTAANDVICGLGGDDIIYGLGGNDIIVGGRRQHPERRVVGWTRQRRPLRRRTRRPTPRRAG